MVLEAGAEVRRFANISRATMAKYPDRLKNTVVDRTDIKNFPYNNYPEELFGELLDVVEQKNATIERPKVDRDIRKREYLYYFAAFYDDHNENIGEAITVGNHAKDIIESIENRSEVTSRALTVPEQLECALENCNNNLTLAVVSLALGTRQMARQRDSTLLPDFKVDEQRMLRWKKCVAPFGFQETDDSAGDNYHFWEAVVAGFSVEEGLQSSFTERFKAEIGKRLYENVPELTKIVRHKIAKKEGKLHGGIDTLGFNVGRGLYASLSENS